MRLILLLLFLSPWLAIAQSSYAPLNEDYYHWIDRYEVKLWSHADNAFINTGLQFCGLMMGDHSKCSINSMFNTGTVVDVSSNVFGDGFPRNYIPSFTWGGAG